MDQGKLDFITKSFVPEVEGLSAEAMGKWGKMNAQQMAEHLTTIFNNSSGKMVLPILSPPEHLEKLMAFLYSDKEFRENTKAPEAIFPTEPLPVVNSTMAESVAALQQSVNDFTAYFSANPGAKTTHPVFGELNYEEWVLLHYKHVTHHLRQFGWGPGVENSSA